MNNNIDINKLILSILAPVIDFLKQHNLWDSLVKIYQLISGIVINLWAWLENNIGTQKLLDFLITFIKFVLNIFLTLFNVLSQIVNWALHLLK